MYSLDMHLCSCPTSVLECSYSNKSTVWAPRVYWELEFGECLEVRGYDSGFSFITVDLSGAVKLMG